MVDLAKYLADAPDDFLIEQDRYTTRTMIEMGSISVQSNEALGLVLRELHRRGLVEIVRGDPENITSATLHRHYHDETPAHDDTAH